MTVVSGSRPITLHQMLELHTHLGIAYRTFSRSIDAVLRHDGLTFAKYEVLDALVGAGELHVTLAPLADQLRRHWTTLSATVERLESQGMATRRPNPDNRRQTLIDVTPGGREAHARATGALRTLSEGDSPPSRGESTSGSDWGRPPIPTPTFTLADIHALGLVLREDADR
ncbi:MarR family transcriptional regulator [Rhodococcus sp. USK10]|uniref:MarR family winged helix-turn-helix transcriptional regulator n=1 Tax=Rhodococcus sp. USK10 TaxID=2789739 RepID=UPI001C5DA969|nr:MarR family transcriptional regulator [Rhodococcus sp. USK10]QYB00821.1 MarR family transcriptional regulator [Rhodococcus sp. USK10]